MREIGGYIEFEKYSGPMLHSEGILLNNGRNCLAYLIKVKEIRSIVMPYFMCDSVFDVCRKYGVAMRFYHIGDDFRPRNIELNENEYLYLMNYYGQLTKEEIEGIRDRYVRVILDNAHDYYANRIKGIDTIYTCRKYFGVPDGAILYTDTPGTADLKRAESYNHMNYLMGRFERTASEFYAESVENNLRMDDEPIMKMSRLTENLLRGIDYKRTEEIRRDNYRYLHEQLKGLNRLHLEGNMGTFMYPFTTECGGSLRKKLQQENIYIPVLWPNVICTENSSFPEYAMARDILPLPVDQRYNTDDMEYIANRIKKLL